MSVSMPPFSDYRDIGRALRDTRESMGLALEDVARQLKVRQRYLQSLEMGEMGDIPGEVYARGYLRMYADYLGYDGHQMMTGLQGSAPSQRPVAYQPQHASERSRTTLLVMLCCLLALLAFVLWQMNRKQAVPEMNLVDAVPSSLGEQAAAAPLKGEASMFPKLCQTSGERLLPETICRGDALLTPARTEEEAALSTIMELREPDALWRRRM